MKRGADLRSRFGLLLSAATGLMLCLAGTMITDAGCQSVHLRIRPVGGPDGQTLSAARAFFARRDNAYDMIAHVPRSPDLLEILSLGRVKDTCNPAYYVRIVVPMHDAEEAATVSVLVAPWELGQLYMGTGRVSAVLVSPRELEVRVAANTVVQLGWPKGQAVIEVQGKFIEDEKGWSQLLSGWEDENERLARVCERVRLD